METKEELKKEVKAAVRAFVLASGNRAAQMSSLVEVTARLPLDQLSYWEVVVRSECYLCTPPIWKFWMRRGRPSLPGWMGLISLDGYVRENRLRTLHGAAPNAFFLALAVRKLNDWVPEVRAAARERLHMIIQSANPIHVVEVICSMLPRWNSWGRMDEAGKSFLLNFISNENIIASLKFRIINATTGSVTTLFSQLGRFSILDAHLAEISSNAVQPSVRAKAYRCQLEEKMVWAQGKKQEWMDIRYNKVRTQTLLGERKVHISRPYLETLRLAAMDRSPMVRRVAVDLLVREAGKAGSELLALATILATDPSPSIAERARFVLKRLATPENPQ